MALANLAPSFTSGPDIQTTDNQSNVAPMSVISFSDLSSAPDSPFFFDDNDSFFVHYLTGRWMSAQEGSHVTGNPGPGIWGDTFTGSLEIASIDGGEFSFSSFDGTSWNFGSDPTPSSYTMEGFLNGQMIYSKSGELPAYESGGFVTIDSPSASLVDAVKLSFIRGFQGYVVDNIRVINPSAASVSPWATNISPGSPDESGQTVNFKLTGDTHPELFQVPPAIDPQGRLTFQVKPNANGSATISVALHDDGGTADGGVDASSIQTFKINVSKQHIWQNTRLDVDVDDDGLVSASDVIAIINYINAHPSSNGAIPSDAKSIAPFLDADGDGFVASSDVIAVINYINAGKAENVHAQASASLIGIDATTRGDWQGSYGKDGYDLAAGAVALPSYARVNSLAIGSLLADSTADKSALERPDGSGRFVGSWQYYDLFDIALTDNSQHQIGLYLLDWGGNDDATEYVDVIDAATGKLLNTQAISAFSDGKYLLISVSGHVQIRFRSPTNDSTITSRLSGIFFG